MSRISGALQILQQQQALKERKEERHHDLALQLLSIDMKEKAIDIAASKDLYNENRKLYYDALDNLENLESTYGETVGSLEPLSEMYTKSGKDVTADIYEGEAKDYQGRADQALENWQAIRNKISILKGSLYGDVKRAKNIMAGGAGFQGGVDPEKWDLSDLGIIAYESRFGESSPTVVSMFKNNPGLMTSSLASLQKTEGTLGLTEEKREYYKRTGIEKSSDDAMKQSELVFGTLASSAIKTSGKQEYDGLIIQAENLGSEADETDVANNKARQFTITKEIGEEFSKLTGQDVAPEDYIDITSDYFEMLSLGRGASAVRRGQTAYGNWSVYYNYVAMARDEYIKAIKAGDSEKARKLNTLAEKYFGMPSGQGLELTTFAQDMGEYFSSTILASFGAGIINEDSDDESWYRDPAEPSNINIEGLENIEQQEWEDLLSP
jgi:hypothetical protein